MTRLERSIALEVIPSFFLGALLYIAVFLVQRVLSQPYLSALPATSFLPWLLYQVPAFALQAFPMAAVFAVLLAFGRLARENELIAAAAGGVSLARAVRPVLVFGALLAVAGFLIAEFIAPRANELTAKTWWTGVSQSGNALERVVGKPLAVGGNIIFIGGIDKQDLLNVRYESWSGNTLTVYDAKRARFVGKYLQLVGYRGFGLNVDKLPAPDRPDQTWINDAFPFSNVSPNPNAKISFELPKTADRVLAENAESGFEDSRRLSELWQEYSVNGKDEAGAQLGFKTAQPLASLVILLFGIPIAARGARSTGVAFGLAVVIAVGFYVALYLGRTLSLSGILPPLVGPWLANIGFLIAGFWLFRSRTV